MSRRTSSDRSKRVPIGALCLAAVLILLLAGSVQATPSEQEPDIARAAGGAVKEILTVPFVLGPAGVQSNNAYSGSTAIAVSGIGQAAGSQGSDAFYIFTDYEGNPVEPWHPTEFYNWTLWINGGPADNFVAEIPPYNPDHIYVFTIDAPGGPLTLAVGDAGIDDNTGQYEIGLRDMRGPRPIK